MSASQIALIGQNHSPQNRISGLEQNRPDPERSQIQKGRRFHWVPMTLASWRSILANDTPDKECYFTISWGLLIASYQKRNTNRLYSFMSNSPVSLNRRELRQKDGCLGYFFDQKAAIRFCLFIQLLIFLIGFLI